MDPEILDCDVWALKEALERHDHAVAVGLYHGDFLDGFAVQGCSEFEDWASKIRRALQIEVCDAALKAADSSSSLNEATRLLSIARTIRPYDEAILRRYLRLQHQLGSPSAGLRAYEDFRKLAANEMGTKPAAETRLLADSLLAGGDQAAGVKPAAISTTAAVYTSDVLAVQAGRERRAQLRSIIAASVVLIASGLIGYILATHVFAERSADPFISVGKISYVDANDVRFPLDAMVRERLQVEGLMDAGRWRGRTVVATGSARPSSDGILIETRIHDGAVLLSSDTHLISHAPEARVARVAASRILRQIASLPDISLRERSFLRIGSLISDAAEHRIQGSFDNSDFDLERADELLSGLPDRSLHWHLLKSRRLEGSAWNYLMKGHAREAAAAFDESLKTLLTIPSPTDAMFARMGAIQYSRSLLASHGADVLVDSAIALSKQALRIRPDNGRAWLTLSEAQFALGRYVDALSSAAKARRLLPFMESDLQLSVRYFLAAFNAGADHIAFNECTRIHNIDPHQWPAVSCSAMLYGWTDTEIPMRELQRAARNLPDTPELFAANKQTTQMLVASALAQRGDDSDVQAFDVTSNDVDARVFWISWRSLSDLSDASRAYRDLLRSPNGVRASRTYARLLRSAAEATTHSPVASRAP